MIHQTEPNHTKPDTSVILASKTLSMPSQVTVTCQTIRDKLSCKFRSVRSDLDLFHTAIGAGIS
jgi:hypothetical protein